MSNDRLSDGAALGARAALLLALLSGLAALALAPAAMAAPGPICQVTTSGTSGGAGTWASPMRLDTALAETGCTEVWVASGIYVPDATSRTISFVIRSGVAVYGGFAGGESVRSARDPAANVTVLSGDTGGDDVNADGNGIDETTADIRGGNSIHVVVIDGMASAATASTVLDGFTITGGYASESVQPQDRGGGVYCVGIGSGHECSPTLANLRFTGNYASVSGGALLNAGQYGGISSPTLRDVVFSNNSATYGGAVYNDGNSEGGIASPAFSNVTFIGNTASGFGGAMYNNGSGTGTSNPVLRDVTFADNSAQFGGAMFDDGGDGASNPTLANVTFSGNSASNDGGAMYNYGAGSTGHSSPMLSNVTFSGNTASGAGSAMYNDARSDGASSPVLRNVILWDGTGGSPSELQNNAATTTIDHSVVRGGCTAGDGNICTNVITADPKLLALADNGGTTPTLLPDAGSSAIDAGDDSVCASLPVGGVDQRGVVRPQGAHCDIGAVEVVQYVLTASVVGGGSVSGAATPLPVVGGIAACTAAGGSTCVAGYAPGSSVTLLATPDVGQHFVAWSGDCDAGGRLTMDAAKTCVASFAANSHDVGVSVSGLVGSGLVLQLNGAETLPISGNGSFAFATTLDYGAAWSVTVATQPAGPAQTCTLGDASGSMPDEDVEVQVSCVTDTHVVSAVVSAGQGAISPTTQDVDDGASTLLTVTPSTGWHVDAVTGCGGSLSGASYTTGAITADCTVSASFGIDSYTVTAAVTGDHGSVSPTSVSADYGDVLIFTLVPDRGYHVRSVEGCGGTLSDGSYTTAPINGACAISVTFALTVTPAVPVPALDPRLLLLLAGVLGSLAALRLRRR
ncbi:MAG TPA: choice-of-anchor Q domain-containing protein [Rhodanobacteraceae bacterium]|nr:choice-of-anchor Q domain-containing protein [Rhodanobacteraceae bacterium]